MRCKLCGQKDYCGADMLDKDDLRELVDGAVVEHLVVLHRVLYGTLGTQEAIKYLHGYLRDDADLADMGRPLKYQYRAGQDAKKPTGGEKMEQLRKKYRPLCDGLSVSFDADGAWLRFESSNGKSAIINIEATFKGEIISAAILGWINDRIWRGE